MRTGLLWRVTCVMIAAFTSVACSGSSNNDTSTDSLSAYEEALAERLRDPGTDDQEDDHERGQRFLVTCMAAEGFTYHPLPRPRARYEALGLTERQFKLKYGWGVSTLIDRHQAEIAATPDDPNERELANMSDAQQTAHGQAMVKCEQAMVVELGVLPQRYRLPAGSALLDAINEALEAASADRRVVDELAKWADCMRKNGFDYARDEQLQQELTQRVEPLRQAYVTRGQARVNQGSTWESLTVKDVLTTNQLDQLAAIQVFELAAAESVVACEDQGIDVTGVAGKVQAEYLHGAMEDF